MEERDREGVEAEQATTSVIYLLSSKTRRICEPAKVPPRTWSWLAGAGDTALRSFRFQVRYKRAKKRHVRAVINMKGVSRERGVEMETFFFFFWGGGGGGFLVFLALY